MSLFRGRCADLVEGAVADGDGVAGQGGQVVEQAAEAAVRAGRSWSCWREALAWAAAERRAGATGLSGAGGCLVGEGQRGPGAGAGAR